jgi:ferrous iron transport protein A
MSQNVALDCVPKGSRGKVISLDRDAGITCRLLELGVTRGSDIAVNGCAPLGDPIIIGVRGCQLAIRRKEAHTILVEVA